MTGPPIRTDIVDVYVFRRRSAGRVAGVEFLQLHRVPEISLPNTWQPVMGHMHADETAAGTALRELQEETGYGPGAGLLGFWQLERLNTYFLHSHETIVMSPCFAAEVAPPPAGGEPVLDADHDGFRWVARDHVDRQFLWPGQREAIADLVRDVLAPGSPTEPLLRIDPAGV
ncbi:NUDIX domain-containing protein [Phycisphaerales bacterium AB-hyl4]|uniref:NUDIX domain-containing protein n=1 Tax=Natronomicrosphaera hydrolytica TaxID=3242702 RepID=A0ABV4U2Q9_9BACT